MGKHVLHQRRALDAFRRAGPVIDFGGGHQLAALLKTGDEDGRQTRAGRVNSGGVTGGARADNQDFRISQNVLLIEFQGKY